MTPAIIIKKATADGIRLALSPAGTIKAIGDQAAVNRWLPTIREHKPGIVKALLEADASTGSLEAIRAWLAHIGETDPAIIGEVLDKCSTDADALDYFTRQVRTQAGIDSEMGN